MGSCKKIDFRSPILDFWLRLPTPNPQAKRSEFGVGKSKKLLGLLVRARQRSGEGVVRRNGCPKGCFWRVSFFSCSLKVFMCLKGAREETDSPKTPFWTTVSPHDAFAAPLACPQLGFGRNVHSLVVILGQMVRKWISFEKAEQHQSFSGANRHSSSQSPALKRAKPALEHINRHRLNGVGRGGGQPVVNQILTRFHGIRLKSV